MFPKAYSILPALNKRPSCQYLNLEQSFLSICLESLISSELPSLVADSIDDEEYSKAIFAIQDKASMEHIRVAESWSQRQPFVFPEEVTNEIEMIIRTVSYPDVALLQHLLTIDGIDTQRISEWMHFSTNLYPIYSQKA